MSCCGAVVLAPTVAKVTAVTRHLREWAGSPMAGRTWEYDGDGVVTGQSGGNARSKMGRAAFASLEGRSTQTERLSIHIWKPTSINALFSTTSPRTTRGGPVRMYVELSSRTARSQY